MVRHMPPLLDLESIRILLAYANHHDITLYQMDIKSAFLNDEIEEEVYVKQPPGLLILRNPIMFTNFTNPIMLDQVSY